MKSNNFNNNSSILNKGVIYPPKIGQALLNNKCNSNKWLEILNKILTISR